MLADSDWVRTCHFMSGALYNYTIHHTYYVLKECPCNEAYLYVISDDTSR